MMFNKFNFSAVSRKNYIKALLAARGIKEIDIARRLNITRSAVSLIINGHKSSRRVQKTISDMLNIPYEQLWGKFYKAKKRN